MLPSTTVVIGGYIYDITTGIYSVIKILKLLLSIKCHKTNLQLGLLFALKKYEHSICYLNVTKSN